MSDNRAEEQLDDLLADWELARESGQEGVRQRIMQRDAGACRAAERPHRTAKRDRVDAQKRRGARAGRKRFRRYSFNA